MVFKKMTYMQWYHKYPLYVPIATDLSNVFEL